MSQTKAQLIDNLVQPITGALGSASAPTFSFTADPNTGIYSPGADQLAISTGGSETVNISSNGVINQGIVFSNRYSTVPTFSLRRAQGTQSSPTVVEAGGYICGLLSGNAYDGSAYQSLGGIRFVSDGAISNTSSPGYITFSTTPSGSTANTERLRITSDGKVGVGTSSPTAKTEISYSSTVPSLSSNSGAALALAGTSAVQFNFGTNPSSPYNAWIQTRDTGTNSAFPLSINPLGGNVGIGTSSPGRNLTVQNSSTIVAASLVSNPANIAYLLFGDTDSDAQGRVQYDNSSDSLQLYSSGSERVRIDSSGRLLVGTSSSQAGAGANDLLQVVGPIQIVSSTNIYSRLVPSSTGLNIISNAYPANVGTTQNIKMSIGSSGGGGPNDVLLLRSTGQHMIGAAVSSTIGIDYPLEVISSSSAGVQGGLASYYGLISGMGYAVNHGSDNDNSCGVTFELSTQNIGGWRPGSFFVQVARCKGDATLATSAWYYYNFIMYAGSIGGSAVLQDSGGATGSFTISVTSTTGSWDGGTKQSVILKVAVNSGSFSDAYTTMVVNLNTYNQIIRSERTSS